MPVVGQPAHHAQPRRLDLTGGLFRAAHLGIHAGFASLSTAWWSVLLETASVTLFDLFMGFAPLPLTTGWMHEEGHRAVMRVNGVLKELKVKIGDTVNIGDLVAVLEGAATAAAPAAAPAPVAATAPAPAPVAAPAVAAGAAPAARCGCSRWVRCRHKTGHPGRHAAPA